MLTDTLTSLAILKVNIDQGKDYLDYLRPFILQVLVEEKPDEISDTVISNLIRARFGLEIPDGTVHIVLRRLSRAYPIKRERGVYRITGHIPDPGISAKQVEAKRHVDAVVNGLMEFSSGSLKPFSDRDRTEASIRTFLANFNVSCLRAYRRGTAIPDLTDQQDTDIVLVSKYAIHLQKTNPERFDSFMIMVQGHMLANALLCPDLSHVSDHYKQVAFYLDTPLLVQLLGLEGNAKQDAVTQLLRLLKNLDGKVQAFSHSRDELRGVIQAAAMNLEIPDGKSPVVIEARRSGTTKSDLLLVTEQVDNHLNKAGIEITTTPRYTESYQIDEQTFEDILADEVSYSNPRAMLNDINSVRSIYVLRKNLSPPSLEKSRAVLVTSNTGFADAAWRYEQQFQNNRGPREVSTVIGDLTLANLAWLKAPLGATTLPSSEIIALAYAALEPSRTLLDKYLAEIDRLEQQGDISPRDHQLLRSSPMAYDELVALTLGDETTLTEETVKETLDRISREIKEEESGMLVAEQSAHRITQEKLKESLQFNRDVRERIYWQCHRRAALWANVAAVLIGVLLIGDLVAGFMVWIFNGTYIALAVASPIAIVAGILTLVSRWFGISVMEFRRRVREWLFDRFRKQQSNTTGIELRGDTAIQNEQIRE